MQEWLNWHAWNACKAATSSRVRIPLSPPVEILFAFFLRWLSVTMMVMLVLAFFSWWYGRGWRDVALSIQPRVSGVLYNFSVTQLLRTLFAPWRRIITYPGSSLGDRLRAWGDNMFSRAIGFVVRVVVLIAAFITVIAVALLSLAEVVIWPLLPLAVPILFVVGVV